MHPRTSLCSLLIAAATLGMTQSASAGNDGNFVLYNQHMAEKGEKEVSIFSDFAHTGGGAKDYTAQVYEIEYGVTDLWTTAAYLESAETYGENYGYASFRFENRVRLFKEETLFNPVLYAEYDQKQPQSRYISSVVGRTDTPTGPSGTEHELETKLIVGHDLTDRFTVAFNWINEVKLDNGLWSFGYAAGFNYVLMQAKSEAPEERREKTHTGSWDVETLTLGFEAYGGLGDSALGLTADPNKTEQYAGINLEADFKNQIHVGIGGAFGLTKESEDAILRLTAGYEFE